MSFVDDSECIETQGQTTSSAPSISIQLREKSFLDFHKPLLTEHHVLNDRSIAQYNPSWFIKTATLNFEPSHYSRV